MISVEVGRHALGCVEHLRISGHADFAEPGQDVVCAAISTLAQTAVLGLQERLGLTVSFVSRRGLLTLAVPHLERLEAAPALAVSVLLDTIVLAMEQIARQHPDHVQVRARRKSSPRGRSMQKRSLMMEKLEALPLMLAEKRPCIAPRRMVGVGLLGAVTAMTLYYLYNMLNEETRDKLQDQVTSMIKLGIQKIALD